MASFTVDHVFVLDESPEEAFGASQQQGNSAMASGDERARALSMIKAAESLALMGRTDEAHGYAAEAMSVCTEMKFEEGRAAAMNAMTKIAMKRGRDAEELEEALDSGMDTLKLCRKLVFKKGEAVALLSLSSVYTAMGNAPQALKYAKEALPHFAELGEARSVAAAYKILMEAYLIKSPPDTSRAAKQLNKAFAIYEEAKDKSKMAKCMHTLATVEAKGGDYKKASEALTKAKELFVEAGDAYGQAAVLDTLMGFYLEAGMYVEAIRAGQGRVDIFHECGDLSEEASAMVKLSQTLLDNEDTEKACALAQGALSMFAGLGDMNGLKRAKDVHDEAKREQQVEDITRALGMAEDFTHIPRTLIVDPGLTKRVGEAYASAMH